MHKTPVMPYLSHTAASLIFSVGPRKNTKAAAVSIRQVDT